MSPDILEGGAWVVTKGVARWVDCPAVLAAVREPLDLTELIACPTCHAKVVDHCRQPGGRARPAHESRLAPRLCACGQLPTNSGPFCDDCRFDARSASVRAYVARRQQRRESEAA